MDLKMIATGAAVAWAVIAVVRVPRWTWIQAADTRARDAAVSGTLKVPARASASQLAVLAKAGYGLPAAVTVG